MIIHPSTSHSYYHHIFINNILMLKLTILGLICVSVMTAEVPCTVTQESPYATISDCSASKQDSYVMQWGLKISFKKEVEHRSDNWQNLLSDNVHPRLPYFPLGGDCQSEYGRFQGGQSVLLNCTQEFEDIPSDYVNTIILLDDSSLPLVLQMKLPLSQEGHHLGKDVK